jgi:hypothetical protein
MRLLRSIWFFLATLLFGWLVALYQLLVALFARWRRARRRASQGNRLDRATRAQCVPIDHPAYVRPDPLIYAQYYLSRLGHAVTWDNPDIWLTLGGQQVPSSKLEPDTEYAIVVRVWNASTQCPAIQVPVHVSFLHWGVGTVPIPIGTATVTVGVKGSASQPAQVSVPWRTPVLEGHYCIQARLDPVDDLNYANNLGQENTIVGHAHSPAEFSFALRNGAEESQQYRFEVDAYVLGEPDPCPPSTQDSPTIMGMMVPAGADQATANALNAAAALPTSRHAAGGHPLPPGWTVLLDPESPTLDPEQEVTIQAVVTPPEGWTGRQSVNVNAYTADGLAGGVTLTVVAGMED